MIFSMFGGTMLDHGTMIATAKKTSLSGYDTFSDDWKIRIVVVPKADLELFSLVSTKMKSMTIQEVWDDHYHHHFDYYCCYC